MNETTRAGRASDVADAIDRVIAAEHAARASIEAEVRRAEVRLETARALRRVRMERMQARLSRLHAAMAARIASLDADARMDIAGRTCNSVLPDQRVAAAVETLAARLSTPRLSADADAP
jgi:hypothetical protein